MTVIQTELQLDAWIGRARRGTRRKSADRRELTPGLRFAFYGRTSTERFQDRWTSLGWQREVAAELVAGHGRIVREFFDDDLLAQSGSLPVDFQGQLVGLDEPRCLGEPLAELSQKEHEPMRPSPEIPNIRSRASCSDCRCSTCSSIERKAARGMSPCCLGKRASANRAWWLRSKSTPPRTTFCLYRVVAFRPITPFPMRRCWTSCAPS